MGAGPKRVQIGIERSTPDQDDHGDEIPHWAEIGRAWAEVFYGRGDERREAAVQQGSQPATFVVYDNPFTRSITLEDRITHDGGAWDVKQNVAAKKPGDREITAVRAT